MTKLNLGCGDIHYNGFINVDIFPSPTVDLVADLTQQWPWDDNSIEHILAHDVIEHLPNKIHTMNEAWRVLCDNGKFEIRVPTTNGVGAWQDPTHVSYWNVNSFLYYEKDCHLWVRFHESYGISACFRMGTKNLRSSSNGEVLDIILRAVK